MVIGLSHLFSYVSGVNDPQGQPYIWRRIRCSAGLKLSVFQVSFLAASGHCLTQDKGQSITTCYGLVSMSLEMKAVPVTSTHDLQGTKPAFLCLHRLPRWSSVRPKGQALVVVHDFYLIAPTGRQHS